MSEVTENEAVLSRLLKVVTPSPRGILFAIAKTPQTNATHLPAPLSGAPKQIKHAIIHNSSFIIHNSPANTTLEVILCKNTFAHVATFTTRLKVTLNTELPRVLNGKTCLKTGSVRHVASEKICSSHMMTKIKELPRIEGNSFFIYAVLSAFFLVIFLTTMLIITTKMGIGTM